MLHDNMLQNSHNVLIPLGGDMFFKDHQELEILMRNYEALKEYYEHNRKYKIVMKFGTISEYFSAIKRSNTTVKTDLHPYNDVVDSYWSGVYSLRPLIKQYERTLMNRMHTAESLYQQAFNLAPS